MNLHRRLYDWMLHWAGTPSAGWALFLLSMAEASFFPIPPDVLLAAMVVADRTRAWRWVAVCSSLIISPLRVVIVVSPDIVASSAQELCGVGPLRANRGWASRYPRSGSSQPDGQARRPSVSPLGSMRTVPKAAYDSSERC